MNKTRPGLEQLDVLVGTWAMESKKYPEGRGRQAVVRIENGAFLRLETKEEDSRFPASTQIISSDDSRDVRRVYQMSVVGGVWMMWREAPDFNQRYIGNINDGGKTIAGQWEVSKDGTNWEVDFDLTYTKIDG